MNRYYPLVRVRYQVGVSVIFDLPFSPRLGDEFTLSISISISISIIKTSRLLSLSPPSTTRRLLEQHYTLSDGKHNNNKKNDNINTNKNNDNNNNNMNNSNNNSNSNINNIYIIKKINYYKKISNNNIKNNDNIYNNKNTIIVHGFPFVSEVFFFRESYE